MNFRSLRVGDSARLNLFHNSRVVANRRARLTKPLGGFTFLGSDIIFEGNDGYLRLMAEEEDNEKCESYNIASRSAANRHLFSAKL
jgi:hypothetical protein